MVSRPKIYEKHPTKNEIRWRYIDEAFDKFSRKLITSDTWNLISEMKIYNKCPRADLKNAKILLNKIINLPSGVDILKNED